MCPTQCGDSGGQEGYTIAVGFGGGEGALNDADKDSGFVHEYGGAAEHHYPNALAEIRSIQIPD